jgi:hypothetical protein
MAEKKGNKNDLQARYEALPPEQQREILSRAAKLRKAAMVRKDVRDDWKQEMHSGKLEDSRRREHKLGKLDDDLGAWILKAMAKADEMGIWDSKSAQSQAEMAEGVVTILSRGGGVLLTQAGQEREFMIRPELAMVQKTDLSVGEKVLWSEGPNGRALLERALPRSSILSRPDPTRPEVERVIAVNMDYVGMVASIVVPLFNPSLVDRFLIGIRQSGAKPLLVVTKVDLLDEEAMFLLVFRSLKSARPTASASPPCGPSCRTRPPVCSAPAASANLRFLTLLIPSSISRPAKTVPGSAARAHTPR